MKEIYISDFIQNNLKHNIPNIQCKYNRIIIPRMKWIHSINSNIIKSNVKWIKK